jgi:hypothetical protein
MKNAHPPSIVSSRVLGIVVCAGMLAVGLFGLRSSGYAGLLSVGQESSVKVELINESQLSNTAVVYDKRKPCYDPDLTALFPPDITATMASFVTTVLATNSRPAMQPCAPLERVGRDGDGGKFVCGLRNLKAPCVIYSLGSYNDFSFEQSVSDATLCEIVTADCTVDPKDVKALPPRTKFIPICLASFDGEKDGRNFLTLQSIMAMLNHTHVDLLKVIGN